MPNRTKKSQSHYICVISVTVEKNLTFSLLGWLRNFVICVISVTVANFYFFFSRMASGWHCNTPKREKVKKISTVTEITHITSITMPFRNSVICVISVTVAKFQFFCSRMASGLHCNTCYMCNLRNRRNFFNFFSFRMAS